MHTIATPAKLLRQVAKKMRSRNMYRVGNTVEEDDEQEIRYDGLTRMVPVQDILEALDYETEDEEIDLDDDPTPDEEEDACKAYGLKKPE